jgi:Ubiquitin family
MVDRTVKQVRKVVQETAGIPPDQHRLVFAGRQLKGRKTLSYYKMQNNATLHLVLKLRGC